jgi:hypothetical protein
MQDGSSFPVLYISIHDIHLNTIYNYKEMENKKLIARYHTFQLLSKPLSPPIRLQNSLQSTPLTLQPLQEILLAHIQNANVFREANQELVGETVEERGFSNAVATNEAVVCAGCQFEVG